MKFRDLLNLYKTGQLPEKEKPIVEEEIDKFEALSDYVFSEVSDVDVREISNNNDTSKIQNINNADDSDTNESINSNGIDVSNSEEEDFSKNIKKHIRKAFMKMGAIVLVAVLVVVMFVQLALPPIVSAFYYNPAKEIKVNPRDDEGFYTIQQMEMDFGVFADLTMPMENRTFVQATPLGYGKYDLSFTWTWQSSYDKEKPSVSGQLVRDKLTLSIPDFIKSSHSKFDYTDNVSTHEELKDGTTKLIPHDKVLAEELKSFIDYDLKGIDDDKILKVAISFKDPIKIEKMKKLEDKYGISHAWYAVVTGEKGQEGSSETDLGFSLSNSGYYGYNDSEYPNLFTDIDGNNTEIEQHFASMLKYMSDRKEFLTILNNPNMDMTDLNAQEYKAAYKYIKKNGLNIYGCAAFVDKKSILKMIENEDVCLVRFMEFGQQ